MTKKQGNALRPGIYKVHWKRGGWSWAVIGLLFKYKPTDRFLMTFGPRALSFDGFVDLAADKWRKIARMERAPLAKMEGERK